MPILIRCPSCTKKLRVPDHFAGSTRPCPVCQTALAIPPARSSQAIRAAPTPASRPSPIPQSPGQPAAVKQAAKMDKDVPSPAAEDHGDHPGVQDVERRIALMIGSAVLILLAVLLIGGIVIALLMPSVKPIIDTPATAGGVR
jgi:hypothetical protein